MRAPFFLVFIALGVATLLRNDFTATIAPRPHARSNSASIAATFGQLPIAFEPNRGQTDPRAKFLAHGRGYGIFLTPSAAVLSFPGNSSSALQMRFAGSQGKRDIAGVSQLPGHSNYLIGNDRSRWHTNIPQFSRVRYRDVYPGIDLDFYGRQGRLEYDFDVNPGADFRQIELDFSGAQKISLADNGDLVLALNGRELRFQALQIYQLSGSGKRLISGRFVKRGDGRIAFDIGEYDRTRTLVIDPVLTFSTYLGGAGDESCAVITAAVLGFVPHCPAVTVDAGQRVYVAGATTDTATFPAPPSPPGASSIPPLGGRSDVFVTRINSSGTAVDFTTFIGGSGTDYPVGVAIDSGLNVYITGNTNSADFPTTASAFQSAPVPAGTHVFLTKLDPTGSSALYSTYLAGSGTDMASGLAVDNLGLAYIFGSTSSTSSVGEFPRTPTALQSNAGATNQFFFSKFDPTASGPNSLDYSTFIGGSTPSTGTVTGGAIAVDALTPANVYIAGGTSFTDMPLLDPSQATYPGGPHSVWVAKLTPAAANVQQYTPIFETYFGGSGDDIAYGVATDGTNTLVTGSTTSNNITIPSSVAPFQSTPGGASDAFIAKFSVPTTTGTTPNTVPVTYFTYLGGAGDDVGLDIVSDISTTTTGASTFGNARVAGWTDNTTWPNAGALNTLGSGGGKDAFMARISTLTTTTTTTTTTNPSTVTFVGGSGNDIGTSLAEDSGLNTYVVGETFSGNFPTAAAPGQTPLQINPNGTSDAFVSKLGPNLAAGLLGFVCNPATTGCPSPVPANPAVNPTPVGVGNNITFTYTIFNLGDPVSGVVFTDTLGNGTTASISGSPTVGGAGLTGSCSAATAGATAVCNLSLVNTSVTTTTMSGGTTNTTIAPVGTIAITVKAPAPASPNTAPQQLSVSNIGTLTVPGTNFQAQKSGVATVNDFAIEAIPGTTSQTVTAGDTAAYSLQVVPTGPIPEAVTLSGTGQPAGASLKFNPTSLANLNDGAPKSIQLEIPTTVRVTTPASLFRHGGWAYAFWLPLSGLAFVGGGISRRRMLLALFFAAVLATITLQPACSNYGGSNVSSTTGTPAGTYNITVNAVSGGTRSTMVQLVVK